jgi:predicted GTPase
MTKKSLVKKKPVKPRTKPKGAGAKSGRISADERMGLALGRLREFLTQNIKDTDKLERILKQVDEMLHATPVVAVFGQTGAGKSSLCNALFGEDVRAISHIRPETRTPEQLTLRHDQRSLILEDFPGIGEDDTADEGHIATLRSRIPHVHVILWLLKADARNYGSDLRAWRKLEPSLRAMGKPVLFVLSHADLIQPKPARAKAELSEVQLESLAQKQSYVASQFGVHEDTVAYVSSSGNIGLQDLLVRLLLILPDELKPAFFREASPAARSAAAQGEAKKGFWRGVWDAIKRVTGSIFVVLRDNPECITIAAEIWRVFSPKGRGRR